MSFPNDFLTAIASEKQLTQKETEVFLALFGDSKSRVQITQELHISDSVIGTRLSGIYRKFSITSSGPVKESQLKDYLTTKYFHSGSTKLETSVDSEPNIDALVQELRQLVQPDIQERCGTMRVLDMTQPIALGDIYTSVNILEKITGRRGFERSELMQDVSPETFERFGLGDIRERRIPGLEAVAKFSKLMILGKPGAGKTTFLKHLAIACISGRFQVERVPVFITLKDFAEAKGKPDLLEYITDPSPTPPRSGEGLSSDSPFPGREGGRGVRSSIPIREILDRGRALILLDGLDEVRDTDSSRVLQQIREFSHQFHQNQFIITCRIAAREYTFETFTEVEIADFNDEQIADFSGQWFRSKNDPIKAELFWQKLQEDEPIRELATSPLLLTLLCLVFEDTGSFPNNRAELYQTGVDVLLKKWDVKRNIEREQVYKRLSLKRKEDLLSQIARITFEAGNYFFKQREVERYITQYIQNLPEANTDPEALELDSVAVLKSIEAQHGLFVERARGIYSFSHLTFHEYFTARKIVTSCNPYAADDPTLQGLVSHLTEERWREVFLLTVEMLDSADVLLRLMKAQIDNLLAGDEKLQKFLYWVDEQARAVEAPYKLSAIRSFYLAFTQNLEMNPNSHLCLKVDSKFKLDFEDLYHLGYGFFSRPDDLTGDFILLLFANKFTNGYFNSPISKIHLTDRNYLPGEEEDYFWSYCSSPPPYDNDYFNSYILKILPPQQYYLPKNHPATSLLWGYLDNWWARNNQAWTKHIRAVMFEHRNIGHNWQFNDEQRQLLQQYYEANKLLVDCLNSDCYVSREVRQEIEDTLLLSMQEIEKRKRV
ncbi:MAG: NACHT domain-containing protein [Potamolinea sp.]